MRVTKKCCVILVLLLFLVIGAVTVGVLYGVGTIGKSTDIGINKNWLKWF